MNRTPLDELQRAIEAHKGGRLDQAEAGYQAILRAHPGDPNALNFLGMLRFHQGNREAARAVLLEAVEADPANPHARINLGNVQMALGDLESARESLTRATQLAPELSTAWYNLGLCYRRLKRINEAAECLYKALEHEKGPCNPSTYEALAIILRRAGKEAEAIDLYRRLLEKEPANPLARHMYAALTGEQIPDRAEDAYIIGLFDHFADTFDENLRELEYRAPELLAERVRGLGLAGPVELLDAGCGTGLAGPLLRPLAGRLVGVDLSSGMLQRALQRKVYDELVLGELCGFMSTHPAAFDVIISADTLVYFGALESAVNAAKVCLRPGGAFLFSLERMEDEAAATRDYRLEHHGRYTHAEGYVRRVLDEAGFRLAALETHTLRYEMGEPVPGHVVTAISPGEAMRNAS